MPRKKLPSPGAFMPDDTSFNGARSNLRFVCEALDAHLDESSGIGTVDDWYEGDKMRLTGDEIVDVCAAFYRYEMHKRIPPNALGLDVQSFHDEDHVRFASDCDSVDARHDRAIFSLSDRLDASVWVAVERYDALRAEAKREVSLPHDTPLPRDAFASPQILFGKKNHTRWKRPRQNYNGAFGPRDGVFNTGPVTPFEDEVDATFEARLRMVAVVCFYEKHQRSSMALLLGAMRRRATLAAHLFRATVELQRQARIVRDRRAAEGLRSWTLCQIVGSNEADSLGEALLPYLGIQHTNALLATHSVVRAWGRSFGRHLRLRLLCATSYKEPDDDDFAKIAHRVEEDGSYTMIKDNHIKFQPELFFEFMTHMELPPENNPPYLLRQQTLPMPKHGHRVDPTRSSIRAYLVMDDPERTPVPPRGVVPALYWCNAPRHLMVGDHSEQCYASFPKGGMPKMGVATPRLSSQFHKTNDVKFRIVVVVDVVTKDAPDDVVCSARHVTETPPFRVVSRHDSSDAASNSKTRVRERSAAERGLARLVRDGQLEADENDPDAP